MNSNPEKQGSDLFPKPEQAMFMNNWTPQELPGNWLTKEHESHSDILFPLDVGRFESLAAEAQELSVELSPEGVEAAQKIAEKNLASLPEKGAKVESIINKVKFPASFDLLKPFRGFEKKIIALASLLTILALILVACGAPMTNATGELPSVQPTIATQVDGGSVAEQPIGQESTPVPLENIIVNYGRYEGSETQVDPILEQTWKIISENILSRNLAVPAAIEIVDVSNENVIVEILPQGRPDDYPIGTNFTVSYVDGHEGELLAITTEGANSVLGSFRAVGLAISVDQLPVALDANGNPVAHVDKETGQWLAGGAALATDPVAEVEQVDLLNTPINEVAQMLAEGKIEYPSDWEDSKKAELAVAFAEYLNSITADEVYVPLNFPEVGDIKVGWDPVTKQWRSNHNTPEGSLDFTGDSLPELVVPGYTNAEGQEVIIDPETGEERVVPKINMPGLGEVTITQLYTMGQTQLRDYAVDLMLETNGLADRYLDYIQQASTNRFVLPVVINKNVNQNYEIYSTLRNGSGNRQEIPEANKAFFEVPTNEVLMPIFSSNTKLIIGWLTIQQGTTTKTHSFTIQNGVSHWDYTSAMGDTIGFGGKSNHSMGILIPGNTIQIAYENFGEEPLLENGNGSGGIGGGPEILKLLNVLNTQELIQLLMELRLLILFPDEIIYPDN